MKLPLTWLRDYVDCGASVQELSDALTFSGVEVEGIETCGTDLTGMVVAAVEDVRPHPNADRLTLCTAFDGEQRLPVVCGAPNVRPGMRAAFAPVGSVLANGMKLKKAKIRGEVSRGMLCAEDELGLSDDHEGIIELPADTEPGTPLAELLGGPETVLDLEITPNRPDCLSIIGLAREVAALYGRDLRIPAFALPESGDAVETLTRVDLEDPAGCPRYTARIVRGVEVAPSPDWMQKRLQWCGIRPINNLVDITNFVLLECGQPLHAFDRDRLREGRIVVRRAHRGERMHTLDDVERPLDPDMLVIADAEGPVALAGVMGGAGSEIGEATRDVLLESAFFDPGLIRRTARAAGLSTDSSYRFERGVDIGCVDWASRRAAALMAEHAGGAVAPGVIDAYPDPAPPVRVPCRWSHVRDVVGVDAPDREIRARLEAIGLTPVDEADRAATFEVPSWRGDLTREIDLVEEFARLHGLQHIPVPAPRARIVPDADDTPMRARSDLRRDLVGLGLQEIVNYSLVSGELLDSFDPDNADRRVELPNPISADQSILRTSLLPQMVETLGRNRAHQVPTARLFELGTVFSRQGDGAAEEQRLALGLLGPAGRPPLAGRDPVREEEAFAWLKGLIEALLARADIRRPALTALDSPLFEPGRAVEIRAQDRPIGRMGLVRRGLRESLRIETPLPVAELAVAPLVQTFGAVRRVASVAPYPPVSRDISLFCRSRIRHGEIEEVIRRAAPKELENISLFDIFAKKDTDQKSLAYSLTYRAADRSLTDEEANSLHEQVVAALRAMSGVELREG